MLREALPLGDTAELGFAADLRLATWLVPALVVVALVWVGFMLL